MFTQTDPLSTEYLWSNSRTQTRHTTIAPHWSSSYPEYLSPEQGQEEQRRVVWLRLHNHRANLADRLSSTRERYLAARRALNPKTTQAELSHDPLYCDILGGIQVECPTVPMLPQHNTTRYDNATRCTPLSTPVYSLDLSARSRPSRGEREGRCAMLVTTAPGCPRECAPPPPSTPSDLSTIEAIKGRERGAMLTMTAPGGPHKSPVHGPCCHHRRTSRMSRARQPSNPPIPPTTRPMIHGPRGLPHAPPYPSASMCTLHVI